MAAKLIIFSACVVAALGQYSAPAYRPAAYAAPAQYYNAPRAYAQAEPSYPPTPYQFEYSVNEPTTYDVHSQSESSDGAGNVKGVYSLLEADGSTRVVEYTAGAEGFNAVVKKADGAAYKSAPAAYSAPAYTAPAYRAPAPVYAAPAPVYAAPAYRAPAPAYVAPAYAAAPAYRPAYTPAPAAYRPY